MSLFDKATPVDFNQSNSTPAGEPNAQPPVSTPQAGDPPAAEPPAATPPAGEPGGQPPASGAPPVVDTVAPHTIFGDEYKDKKWDDVKSEYQSLRQKTTEYEKQIEAAKNTKPSYANDEVAAYDAWVRNQGGDLATFSLLRTSDIDKMDGIEAIVAQRVIENPQFKGHEARLRKQIVDQFKLVSTEENPLTDEDISFNKATLEGEAVKSKGFLNGLKTKMAVQAVDPEVEKQRYADEYKKHIDGWNPVINRVFDNFKTVPLEIVKRDETGKNIKDASGQDVYESVGEYVVPEHLQKKYRDLFSAEVGKFPALSADSESRLQASLQSRFKVDNQPYLLTFALDQERTKLIDEYDKKYGGGARPNEPGPKGANVPGSPLSESEQRQRLRTPAYNN